MNLASWTGSNNKALFTVNYIPTQAITTRIIVTLNGQPIQGSPFSVDVKPGPIDPKNCFAEGLGLVTPKTKTPLSFVVITADHYNNRLRTGGNAIAVTLREQKSGTFLCRYVRVRTTSLRGTSENSMHPGHDTSRGFYVLKQSAILPKLSCMSNTSSLYPPAWSTMCTYIPCPSSRIPSLNPHGWPCWFFLTM